MNVRNESPKYLRMYQCRVAVQITNSWPPSNGLVTGLVNQYFYHLPKPSGKLRK